jgi:hypothetical protein
MKKNSAIFEAGAKAVNVFDTVTTKHGRELRKYWSTDGK